MEFIELDSIDTVREHCNLWNTPANQLRRKIGRFSTVYVGDHCGTVRDMPGKYWDWWLDDENNVIVVEAR